MLGKVPLFSSRFLHEFAEHQGNLTVFVLRVRREPEGMSPFGHALSRLAQLEEIVSRYRRDGAMIPYLSSGSDQAGAVERQVESDSRLIRLAGRVATRTSRPE